MDKTPRLVDFCGRLGRGARRSAPMLKAIHHSPVFQNLSEGLRLRILDHGWGTVGPWWAGRDLQLPWNRLHLFFGPGGAIVDDHATHRFRKNLVVLNTPRNRYAQVWEKPFETFYVHFRLELCPTVDAFADQERTLSRVLGAGEGADGIVGRIRSGGIAEGIEVQAWLLRVLAPFVERQAPRLARRLALGTKYRELFSKVEADFRAGERVERLAAGLNLRPRSFQRAFRRDTGSTLKAWLSAQLMERAQSLLLSDPRRIKELARELGFADEHYFSRFFKKHQGRSPQEYRSDWEKAMGRGAPSPGSGPIPRSIP